MRSQELSGAHILIKNAIVTKVVLLRGCQKDLYIMSTWCKHGNACLISYVANEAKQNGGRRPKQNCEDELGLRDKADETTNGSGMAGSSS